MTRTVKLTDAEISVLITAICPVEASDWSEGDYCFTQKQFDALMRAKEKLLTAKLRRDEIVSDHYDHRPVPMDIINTAIALAKHLQQSVDVDYAPGRGWVPRQVTKPRGAKHKHLATVHCDGRVEYTT